MQLSVYFLFIISIEIIRLFFVIITATAAGAGTGIVVGVQGFILYSFGNIVTYYFITKENGII